VTAAPTKRALAKAETRARLVSAAHEHVDGSGRLPTVSEITKAAGVSHGTFYLHFPSMEQLVVELQADLHRQLAAAVGPDLGLGAGLREYVRQAAKRSAAIRALWPVPDPQVPRGPTGADLLQRWLRPHLAPAGPSSDAELDASAAMLATMAETAAVRSVSQGVLGIEGDHADADEVAAACLSVVEHVQDAIGSASRRRLDGRQDHESRAVLVCGERRFTGSELDDRVSGVIGMLQLQGLTAGQRLGTLLHNGPAAVEVNLAAQQMGVGVVPLNTYWRTREIEHVVRQSRMSALVFHDDFRAVIESVDPALRLPLTLIPVGSSPAEERYERQLKSAPRATVDDPPQSATLSYTSGSTGMPKGILREETAAERRRHGLFLASLFDITADDRLLLAGPLHHAANRLFSNVCRQIGATTVLLRHFDAEELLRVVEEERVTVALLVPTMLYRVVKLDPEVQVRYDLSSLRAIVHMGSQCSIDLKQQAMRLFGPIVHEYYGTTEMGGTVIGPNEWLEHPGSVGRAWRSDSIIRVLGEDGAPLPPEAVGRVALLDPRRAPFEYLGDDGEPEGDPLNPDRLFVTDDLGRLDAEGYLYLADRRSAVFKSGGVAVYPAEVEAVITADPAVADCAVTGIPDPEWGHVVAAFVQPLAGHDVDVNVLRASVRTQLAHYKCPRTWVLVDHIPRDGAGKLMRSELPKHLDSGPRITLPATTLSP
jgi:long-chain acyl-CoA synthetase